VPDTTPLAATMDRPIDRALGLAGAVIMAADNLPPVAVLYAELVPGYAVPAMVREATGRALAELADVLPHEAGALLGFINARQDSVIDRLIMLRAALLRLRGNSFWVHHDAARLLDLFGLAAHPETGAPCLLHASTALSLPHEPGHGSMLRLIMARRLLGVAPRDALAQALMAVHQGQTDAMEVARAAAVTLGIIEPRQHLPMSVSALTMLEREAHLPLSCAFEVRTAPPGITVLAPSTITLPAPHGDAGYYAFHNAGRQAYLPGAQVHSFENGTISVDLSLPGRTQFYVFDGDGACIEDLSWGTLPFIAPDVGVIDDDLCVIGDRFMGPMNVCHFILDHFTRIALYDRATGASPKILLAEPHDIYRRILEQAGVADRVVEAGAKKFSFRARRLLVSSTLIREFAHPAHSGSSWALDFVRERLHPPAPPPQTRRLFISREDAASRQIRNWQEVEPVLARHGFEIFTVSAHSLPEQIAAFAAAHLVVGVHGAGMTNIVFGRPGLRVLEILPPLVASPAYWYLCAGMGADYTAFIADDPELPRPDYAHWGHHPEFISRDIVIDPARLDAALSALAAERAPPPPRPPNPLIAPIPPASPEDATKMTMQTAAPPPAAAAPTPAAGPRTAPRALTVIANCQSLPLADALALGATGIETDFIDVNFPHIPEMAAKIAALAPRGDQLVFSVNLSAQFGPLATEQLRPRLGDQLITFTNIHFSGLHPDITYLGPMGRRTPGYFEDYHSKLVLFAYVTGRSVADCIALFTGAHYERIGYFAEFAASAAELMRRDEACNVRYAGMFIEQIKQVPGLFTINHPTGPIFMTLANVLARVAGVPFERFDALFLENPLARNVIWPVYNEIAEQHGLRYRMPQLFVAPVRRAARGVALAEFVAGSYAAYAQADASEFFAMVRKLPFFAQFERVL
jgi:hypothetical protein